MLVPFASAVSSETRPAASAATSGIAPGPIASSPSGAIGVGLRPTPGTSPSSRTVFSHTGTMSSSRCSSGASTVSVRPPGSFFAGSFPRLGICTGLPLNASFQVRRSSRNVSSSPSTGPIGSTVPGRWRKPLNQTSLNVAPSVSSASSCTAPRMWSPSTWLTTRSSNSRSPSGSAAIRLASGPAFLRLLQVGRVPPSMRIRRTGSPYSIHSASPCWAGSISMRSISPPGFR